MKGLRKISTVLGLDKICAELGTGVPRETGAARLSGSRDRRGLVWVIEEELIAVGIVDNEEAVAP